MDFSTESMSSDTDEEMYRQEEKYYNHELTEESEQDFFYDCIVCCINFEEKEHYKHNYHGRYICPNCAELIKITELHYR